MEAAVEETVFSLSQRPPQLSDRRQQSRSLKILRVASLIVDGQRELCLVRNISAGGLMAHVYSSFAERQPVAAEFRSGEPISGSVAWRDGSTIGIAFDDPIDLEDILAGQGCRPDGQKPRMPRVEIDRLATLRAGARLYGANTCNISQGGVNLEVDQPIAPGTNVILTLDGFRPVSGCVRWCEDGLCGVHFDTVIPFRELMGWLRGDRWNG